MEAPLLLAVICGILLVALPGTGASCNRGCSTVDAPVRNSLLRRTSPPLTTTPSSTRPFTVVGAE
jgi:hypothetical protein